MSKPLILLTMSFSSGSEDSRRPHFYLNSAYARAITKAGGLPLCCPYEQAEEMSKLADGLLFTGGVDIEPHRYGEAVLNDTISTARERDEYEWELLGSFIKTKKPILGICRGMQLLSTYLGGTLYQDLPTQLGVQHSECEHLVKAEGGFWRENFGERFSVNSYHHQSVKTLGEGLVPTVWSEDGVLEACETADGLWRSCQWHPELMEGAEGTPDMAPVFAAFLEQCRH